MRQRIAKAAVVGLTVALLVPVGSNASVAAAPAPANDLAVGVRMQLAAGVQVAPKQPAGLMKAPSTPNPYTALLPDPTVVDYSYWARQAREAGARRAAQRADALRATSLAAAKEALRKGGRNAAPAAPIVHNEAEPAGVFGLNDTPATAELITGLGTGKHKNNRSHVLGQISPQTVVPDPVAAFAEDDGSIPLAGDPGVSAVRGGARLSAAVGDGPHGSAGTGNGDFDFIKVTGSAGQQLTIDTDTPVGPLDTVVSVFDSAGTLVAVNDDSSGSLDSFLQFQFTSTTTVYVMVSGFGFGTIFPADPFDSSSGFGTGSEGPYDITITVAFNDRDIFAMDLKAGDVVGASVSGVGTQLVLRDTVGDELMGSEQDASFIYAPSAPLPGGGNAVLDHVAATAGRYTIEVIGSAGTYDLTLELYRPGTESAGKNKVQTLFLDFNGARVNTAIWGGPGVRDLSPLSAFLSRWGLTPADENAVINATLAAINENIKADLNSQGTNPRFDIRIRNSRDHADTFGQANTHRVIVGGSIAESGISTIGIAQFIDPGNYANEDSAVVLLDVLSDSVGAASLNTYITPASSKIEFIGRALANVVAHEAGHLYGSFHTNTFNTVPNLMDAGGNFPGLFGVGPDNIGGTADDVDYDFGEDDFFPNEGFTGVENTLNRSAWGLTKGL